MPIGRFGPTYGVYAETGSALNRSYRAYTLHKAGLRGKFFRQLSREKQMTAAALSIPIAGFKDVYDVAEVDRALQELPASANEALKSTYEKMIKAGGTRLTVKPSGVPAMESLYEELPNFAEVLDDVRKHIALCASSNDCMELPPLLLLG